jgi:hypothetical protein
MSNGDHDRNQADADEIAEMMMKAFEDFPDPVAEE